MQTRKISPGQYLSTMIFYRAYYDLYIKRRHNEKVFSDSTDSGGSRMCTERGRPGQVNPSHRCASCSLSTARWTFSLTVRDRPFTRSRAATQSGLSRPDSFLGIRMGIKKLKNISRKKKNSKKEKNLPSIRKNLSFAS